MHAALQEFERGVKDLRKWFRINEALLELVKIAPAESLQNQLKEKHDDLRRKFEGIAFKVLNYNGFIVSVYGLLERLVENLASGYLRNVERVAASYSDVPEAIKKNHIRLSADLLARIETGNMPPGQIADCKEIVERLHKCLSSPESFLLNAESFIRHKANFRHKSVNEFFKEIGIPDASSRTRNEEPLCSHLSKMDIPVQARPSVSFRILDDLADRRNEVAHGNTPDELLAMDQLKEYLDFIEAYGRTLFRVLSASLLPFEIEQQGTQLGPVEDVFDNKIICFAFPQGKLRLGDRIAARLPGGSCRSGRLKRLEVNGESRETVTGSEGLKVGIEVDFHANENQEFYLIQR